jgi:hypothetical protein
MPMNLLTATTANGSDPWAEQSWGEQTALWFNTEAARLKNRSKLK